jgi:hypothetical protein
MAWIGLNDMLAEGRWHWIHQKHPTTYTNWGPGEPENRNGNENCATMWSKYGSWHDHPCSFTSIHFFVCEMQAIH